MQADDAFHEAVVEGVADGVDRWRDAFQGKVLGEPDRGVLAAGVVVMHQLAAEDWVALSVAVPQRDPQRGEDQVGAFVGGGVPGHDQLSEHVDDGGDVAEPGPRYAHKKSRPSRPGWASQLGT